MRSLWRALAVAWLGGIASPMLTDDAMPPDRTVEERPAAAKPDELTASAIPAQPSARDEPS